MEIATVKPKAPDFLRGGGEMGELMRRFDWNQTSLGAPEDWSPSLKSLLSVMLANRFPMLLWWGPDYIQFYNDPYIPVPGLKHPHRSLGVPGYECWSEIWHVLQPLVDTPYQGGPSTWMDDILLIIDRNNFIEETHFTIAYSAVPDASAPDGIGGVLATVNEITETVVARRQMETLGELGRSIGTTLSEDEVFERALEALVKNPYDIPFARIVRSDQGAGLTLGINDGRWGAVSQGAWDIPAQNYVQIPLRASEASLVLGLNPYRKFDASYRNFVQLIADQVSLGLSNAMAYGEERKRAQALEAIDKAKTIFFSNISHEFRTPLTLILGTLEECLQGGGDSEQMERMHRNAMRLLKLVNSLLDFSRIEDGRQKAVYALTDLGSLTANLAAHFRSLVEKAGLTLTVKAQGILQPVYVDKVMWEKIVFNLLSNAFKYTLAGGITVHLIFDGDHAVMTVEDTGTGIPEKELPHLFERFHRVENALGRSYEGTGIGLSLTRELVKLHGGEIKVRSKMGLGSTFEVRIPFGKSHLPPDQTADAPGEAAEAIYHDFNEIPAAEDEPAKGSGETILVVDDNADMRVHIRSLLQKQFRVLTAANGMEALHKIRSEKPALVVSDIMMPIMDGIQLVREVKGNKTMAHTPVILLTARAGEESKVLGLGTGADDYLVKPFSATELVARIRSQLNIVRRKNEIEEDLRSFLMQAPAAIAILEGSEHTFTLANALYRDMFGLSEDQLLGRTAREVFPEAPRAGVEFLDNVYKSGEIITQKAYWGAGGYFDFTLKPLRNSKGEVTGVMCHVTNVTDMVLASERLEAEVVLRTRELKQINEQLESFNYIASHDLQEPLRKIRTFIQLLEKHQEDPETWKKYAKKIQESTRRMSYLIQSVLEYSRLTQAVESFQLTDLNRILDDLRCDYELLVKEKEAVFLSDPLPMIPAIPTQMEQLFSNLLSNSLKFSREKPLIQVRSRNVPGGTVPGLEPHGTYVEITFSDNGIGFEPQNREKIFQLFQRLHHSSEYHGSGIGLSIVDKIVENHKGIVRAESEEGRGAVFTIWLPLLS